MMGSMRAWWTLLLVACSPSALQPLPADELDGSFYGRDAAAEDAGIDAPSQDAQPGPDASGPFMCSASNSGDTCVPIAPCGGGYRYGCYGSFCSTIDLGVCTLAANNPNAFYAEVCCQRIACTRSARPGDSQCVELDEFDAGGGRRSGWTCPYANGQPLALPPGDCKRRAPSVTSADPEADYCCR